MPKGKTHSEFVEGVKDGSPSITIISEYQNCRTKVMAQCDICGYQWMARPSDLLRGHGCPRCSGKERKTTARFRDEVASANKNVEVVGEYVNVSTKVEVHCRTCGYSWNANPSSLIRGIGCPICGGTRKKTDNEFVEKLSSVNPNIKVLEEYKNNRSKILVQCLQCGHIWTASPHNLIDARSRCPRCTHSSTSFMEQFITEWLSRVLGENAVVQRDKSAIGLELDVYVPSLMLAFEPGSWHWHKDKLENDNLKRRLCEKKGIRLITIYDKVPEEALLHAADVFLFPFDIRAQKQGKKLAGLLLSILREKGVTGENTDLSVEEIVDAAYKNSVKTDTEDFTAKIKEKGISVDVLGIYRSSSSRILVRCKACGHKWSPRADSLLAGNSNCRKCGIVKNGKAHLKSPENYIAEVASVNPTVEVLGRYTKANERIHVKCRLCGYEWKPIANSLVRNKSSACPKCGMRKMIETRMKNKLSRGDIE